MYLLCMTAVLSLLSVSNAKPLPCEEIVEPLVLEDFSKVLGKWIVIEAAIDLPKFVPLEQSVSSSWVEAVPTDDSDIVMRHKSSMINGACVYSTLNLTRSDNTIHFTMPANTTGNSTVTFLRTSADFLVTYTITFMNGDRFRTFHLLGKTGKLENFDRETYDRQRDCLAIPKPSFIYDGHQELCPDKNKHSEE